MRVDANGYTYEREEGKARRRRRETRRGPFLAREKPPVESSGHLNRKVRWRADGQVTVGDRRRQTSDDKVVEGGKLTEQDSCMVPMLNNAQSRPDVKTVQKELWRRMLHTKLRRLLECDVTVSALARLTKEPAEER